MTSTTLVLILTIAAWLRLGDLAQVGIRFEDEAAYFADARLWHRCAKALFSGEWITAIAHGDMTGLKKRMVDVDVDFTARYHKPCQGFTALGAGMMFLVGDRDFALLAVNALSGIVSVLLLWLLGNMLFGPAVGLCAAALLALSPFHLLYSRSAFPDATMIAFSLAAATVWIAGRCGRIPLRRAYLPTGILFGIATICHYRCGSVLLALLIVDAALGSGVSVPQNPNATFPTLPRRWVTIVLGFAIPIALMEGTFRTAQWVARITNSWFPVESFLQAAWALAKEEHTVGASAGGGTFWVLNWSAIATYPTYYLYSHGAVWGVLCALGSLHLCLRRGVARLPVAVVASTSALLVAQPYVVARGMSVMVPFLQLSAAVGFIVTLPALSAACLKVLDFRSKSDIPNSNSVTQRDTRPTLSTPGPPRPRIARSTLQLVASTTAFGVMLIQTSSPRDEVRHRRSDLAAACATLASHGPGMAVVAEDPRKYQVYLERSGIDLIRGQRYRAAGAPADGLDEMRRTGVRWVISDPQRWHYRDRRYAARDDVFRWWQAMEDLLRVEGALVAEFPHLLDTRWEFLADGPGLDYLDEMTQRNDGPIRIYDITPQSPPRP